MNEEKKQWLQRKAYDDERKTDETKKNNNSSSSTGERITMCFKLFQRVVNRINSTYSIEACEPESNGSCASLSSKMPNSFHSPSFPLPPRPHGINALNVLALILRLFCWLYFDWRWADWALCMLASFNNFHWMFPFFLVARRRKIQLGASERRKRLLHACYEFVSLEGKSIFVPLERRKTFSYLGFRFGRLRKNKEKSNINR